MCEQGVLLLLAFTVLYRGGKTLESTWLLFGIASMCSVVMYKQGTLQKKYFDIWIIIMLFILWTLLSYVGSTTLNYGFDEVLRTGGLGLLLLWFLQQESEGFAERFFIWMTNLVIVSCLIGLLVYILQPVNRFVGTFFDMRFHTDYWPNAAADFLLLAWPIEIGRAHV